jgi:hypothetical protein
MTSSIASVNFEQYTWLWNLDESKIFASNGKEVQSGNHRWILLCSTRLSSPIAKIVVRSTSSGYKDFWREDRRHEHVQKKIACHLDESGYIGDQVYQVSLEVLQSANAACPEKEENQDTLDYLYRLLENSDRQNRKRYSDGILTND